MICLIVLVVTALRCVQHADTVQIDPGHSFESSNRNQEPFTNSTKCDPHRSLKCYNNLEICTLNHENRPRLDVLSAIFQSTLPTDHVSRSLINHDKQREGMRMQITSEPARFGICIAGPGTLVSHQLEDCHVVQRAIGSTSTTSYSQAGSYDGPLHFVPASRWSDLVSDKDDESASHLLSLFLTCLNPYWRLVEEDLFLQASREFAISPYCSPFLINAMLACASVRLTTNSKSVNLD